MSDERTLDLLEAKIESLVEQNRELTKQLSELIDLLKRNID